MLRMRSYPNCVVQKKFIEALLGAQHKIYTNAHTDKKRVHREESRNQQNHHSALSATETKGATHPTVDSSIQLESVRPHANVNLSSSEPKRISELTHHCTVLSTMDIKGATLPTMTPGDVTLSGVFTQSHVCPSSKTAMKYSDLWPRISSLLHPNVERDTNPQDMQ